MFLSTIHDDSNSEQVTEKPGGILGALRMKRLLADLEKDPEIVQIKSELHGQAIIACEIRKDSKGNILYLAMNSKGWEIVSEVNDTFDGCYLQPAGIPLWRECFFIAGLQVSSDELKQALISRKFPSRF
jgi:hypothetical protein